MIKLNHVTKTFKKQVAVNIDSLTLEKGDIYGLIGPNGAGKSTIMKMICGLLEPTSGHIQVNGLEFNEKNRQRILQEIGIFIEEPAYYENLTGLENLQILQSLKNLSEADVTEALTLVHLQDHQHKQVKHYSLGMKQRLAIAMAVMGHPRLMILDEPTNGLDPQAREEIRQLIRRLPQAFETTILISSHALDEIEKMVTKIGIIGQGQMLYQGSVQDFKQRHQSQIRLRTADDNLASHLLNLKGSQITEEGLIIPYLSDDSLSEHLTKLYQAQVPLYRVEDITPSLESLFIEFTESQIL